MKFFLLLISSIFFDFAVAPKEGGSSQTASLQEFSDSTRLQLRPDYFLKIEQAYFNGHLFQSNDGKTWEKFYLGILLEDFDSVVVVGPNTTNKIAYRFIPSGMLQINDSITFLIGTKSNFDQQGMILKSSNRGKSWKPHVHPIPQTHMSPHNLVFIDDQIGIAFFGVDQSNTIQYGISLDAGERWEYLRTTDGMINFKKRKIKLLLQPEVKGQLVRKLEGQYSADRGKTYTPISIAKK